MFRLRGNGNVPVGTNERIYARKGRVNDMSGVPAGCKCYKIRGHRDLSAGLRDDFM